MQKLLLILLSGLFLFSCNEEEPEEIQSGFDTFYDLHENDEGVLTFGMPVFIFKLFININNKDVEDAVDQIESIDLFINDEADDAFVKDLYKHFPIKIYKTLLNIKDKDTNIKFLVREKKEKVDELIMIVNEKPDNTCVIMRIGGSFNVKSVEKMSEKIDISGIVKYR